MDVLPLMYLQSAQSYQHMCTSAEAAPLAWNLLAKDEKCIVDDWCLSLQTVAPSR